MGSFYFLFRFQQSAWEFSEKFLNFSENLDIKFFYNFGRGKNVKKIIFENCVK